MVHLLAPASVRSWVAIPPSSSWKAYPSYCEGEKTVQAIKVTNDVAERGAKLIQDFASSVTTKKTQLQQLLQVVEKHRRQLSDFIKSSFGAM